MDCSPPGSSIHGIFQARMLEWVAISFSRGSSWPRDQTRVSWIAGRHLSSESPRKREHNWAHTQLFFRATKVGLLLFSCSVLSDSLRPHGLQHALLPRSSSPKLAENHVHWVSEDIQPSRPLSSPLPPVFKLSSIRVFSNESALHIRWPKYWCFSFSISPSNEYLGLISFRNDWFDLIAVQRILKSPLQHHSLKWSILQPTLISIHAYWKNHSLD